MPLDEDLTALSYTRGEDRPLLDLTIGELLYRTASRYPDRLAVASRHQSKRMTWAELSDAATDRRTIRRDGHGLGRAAVVREAAE